MDEGPLVVSFDLLAPARKIIHGQRNAFKGQILVFLRGIPEERNRRLRRGNLQYGLGLVLGAVDCERSVGRSRLAFRFGRGFVRRHA